MFEGSYITSLIPQGASAISGIQQCYNGRSLLNVGADLANFNISQLNISSVIEEELPSLNFSSAISGLNVR